MSSFAIVTIRIISLAFAIGLTFVSARTIYRRVKHKRDIFFDFLAFLTGLSMSFHYAYTIAISGNQPIEGDILMAMRFGTMLALFTLFGLLYRRMIVET